jgi:hypothetical protein
MRKFVTWLILFYSAYGLQLGVTHSDELQLLAKLRDNVLTTQLCECIYQSIKHYKTSFYCFVFQLDRAG